ncbi:MAG: acyl-CoA thioesterase [Abditibacteriales bacterium]|nr:acyl-CoA thioesterase [Abditibacteriales bacterium]MDW8364618.1 thioesterase family protein [Abditibacteriales bacterium]
MPYEFKMTHRVEWAETDAAGIIHFASYFRYMEVTEHAFFRSLGHSIVSKELGVGFPRVHASCDFTYPLKFEDEVEAHLRVREKKEKSITYEFIFRKVNSEPPIEVARGKFVVVCVARDGNGNMKAVPIPEVIARQIEVAPMDE